MADLKKKLSPSLRVPKPKKKLGLVVPPPLRMPHDELIAQPTSEKIDSSSMPSQTSLTRHTVNKREMSESSEGLLNSMPSQTSLTRHTKELEQSAAPTRDFARVANSISREAVPAGLFKGKSKQLYDCLYSMTRGAVVPSKSIRISRPKLMAAANIGSRVTFEANIGHLNLVGLIEVKSIAGQHDGNEYTVNLPEEIASTMPSQTSQTSLTGYAQKLVRLVRLETSQTRHTSSPMKSGSYDMPNTFFNTIDDDDTHTLGRFASILVQAAIDIGGVGVISNEQERERWEECARLLAAELKEAAKRTEGITSVPAFFAAHLRRRFASRLRSNEPAKSDLEPKQRITAGRSPVAVQFEGAKPAGSRFSLEDCRRFADHLHKTGQGITSPGGYATTIYRTGEADKLIEQFLSPQSTESPDITRCPDCKGTGFIYPKGIERGVVARCKHPRLGDALKILDQLRTLRRRQSADSDYSEQLLLADLQAWCKSEQIAGADEITGFLLES